MPFPTYKTQDEIPEAFRSEYEQKGDEWVAKVPDVSGAMTSLQAERDRATAEEKLRKKAERDLADFRRTQDAKEKNIPEEEIQRLREADAAARKPLEEKIAALEAETRTLKLTDRVRMLYLEHGGMKDRVEDAMLVLDKRADLGDAGGLVFKDKDGAITTDTPEAFFKKLSGEKPWLFEGTGSSGSGAGGFGREDAPETPAPPARTQEMRTAIAGSF